MKKLFLYIFLGLIFCKIGFTEEITDFELEGMSVGDSLLDYLSEAEINKDKNFIYDSKKFYSLSFGKETKSLKTYDDVQFLIKNNDKKYIIYSIAGRLFYYNNIDDCYKKKNEIVKDLSSILENVTKKDWGKTKFFKNSSDDSTVSVVYFYFKSGGTIKVACYDWSKEEDVTDGLGVIVNSEEIEDFLINEAYN